MQQRQYTQRRADAGAFRHLVAWTSALAIIVLWIAASAAEPITLRVAATSVGKPVDGHPTIYIELERDSQRVLGQFTTVHVGQVIEVRSEGRLLAKAQLRTPLFGPIQVGGGGDFGFDEVVSLASRIAMDGKIEIDASGQPQR